MTPKLIAGRDVTYVVTTPITPIEVISNLVP